MPGVNGNLPQAYHNGSWKNWSEVKGKFNGEWENASDVFVKEDGEWEQVWVRLTAPTNGASSVGSGVFNISWTAGVGQEGFKLYRNGVFVKNVTSGTSTTDPVPAFATNYTYTVSSYAGSTESSQISCGTVQATGPTNGTSSMPTYDSKTASISWTAGVGHQGFKLYRNGTFVKDVAGTSTTDVVPSWQTNYTYTVAPYAGAVTGSQISCGAAVSGDIGPTTTPSISIAADWAYSSDTWNGSSFLATFSWSTVYGTRTGYYYVVRDQNNTFISDGFTSSPSVTVAVPQDTGRRVVVQNYFVDNRNILQSYCYFSDDLLW
jgi:peptidoglycan hydrolase-like protein with peptidoglycan-binding domain